MAEPITISAEDFRKRYGLPLTLMPEEFKKRYGNMEQYGQPGAIKSVEDLLRPSQPKVSEIQPITPTPTEQKTETPQINPLIDDSLLGSLKRSAAGIVEMLGQVPAGFESLNRLQQRAQQKYLEAIGAPKEFQQIGTKEMEERRQIALKPARAAKVFSKKYIGATPGSPKDIDAFLRSPLQVGLQLGIETIPMTALLAGVTALNPIAGEALLYGVEAGETESTFDELERQGVKIDPLYRDLAVVSKGALNAALEKVGIDKILEKAPSGVKSRILKILSTTSIEGITEGLQEVNGVLAESGVKLNHDQAVTLKSAFDNALTELGKNKSRIQEAALGGAIAGGATDVMVEGVRTMADNYQQKREQRPQRQAQPQPTSVPTPQPAVPGTIPPAVAPTQPLATATSTVDELDRIGDEIAQEVFGKPFAQLNPKEQDLIVQNYEKQKTEADAKKVKEAVAKRLAPQPEKTVPVKEVTPKATPPEVPTPPITEVPTEVTPSTVTPEAVAPTVPAVAETTPTEAVAPETPTKTQPDLLAKPEAAPIVQAIATAPQVDSEPARKIIRDYISKRGYTDQTSIDRANEIGDGIAEGTLKAPDIARIIKNEFPRQTPHEVTAITPAEASKIPRMPDGSFNPYLNPKIDIEQVRMHAEDGIKQAQEALPIREGKTVPETKPKAKPPKVAVAQPVVPAPEVKAAPTEHKAIADIQEFSKAVSDEIAAIKKENPNYQETALDDIAKNISDIDKKAKAELNANGETARYNRLVAERDRMIESKPVQQALANKEQTGNYHSGLAEKKEAAPKPAEEVAAEMPRVGKEKLSANEIEQKAKESVKSLATDRQQLVNNIFNEDNTSTSVGFVVLQRELDNLDAKAHTMTLAEWGNKIYFSPPNQLLRWGHPEERPLTRQESEILNQVRREAIINKTFQSDRINEKNWPETNPGGLPTQHQAEWLSGEFDEGRREDLSRALWGKYRVKQHKLLVEQALREGKPVPAEVLAEYPDVQKEAVKKAEAPIEQPENFTRENFQSGLEQLEKTGNLRKGESDLVLAVTDAFAKKWAEWNNSTIDKFYATAFQSVSTDTAEEYLKKYKIDLKSAIDNFRKATIEGAAKLPRPLGATRWENGKAVVAIFEHAKLDTVLHELGHVIQNFLPQDQQRILREWASGGEVNLATPWSNSEKEKFARAWERYLLNGEVPNEELKPIFQRLKELLAEIYKAFKKPGLFKIELTPEVRKVLDGIFEETKSKATQLPPTSKNFDEAAITFGNIIERNKNKPIAEQQAAARTTLEAEGVHPVIIDELVEPRRAPRPSEENFPEEIGISDAYDLLREVETQQYATTRKGRLERAVNPSKELKSKVNAIASAGKAFADAKVSLEKAKEDIIAEIETRGGEVIINTHTGAFTIKINAGRVKLRFEDLIQLKKLRAEAAEAGAYSLATVGRGFEIAVTPGEIAQPKPLTGTFAQKAKEFIKRNQAAKETTEVFKNAKAEAREALLDNYLAERTAGREPSAFKGIAGDGTETEILVRRQRSAVEPDIGEYVEKIERFKEEASQRAETGKPFISTRETGKKTFAQALKEGRVVETRKGAKAKIPPVKTTPQEFGADNTIVTRKDLDNAFASLTKKVNLNEGIDPSTLPELFKIGTFYVEGGLREFKAWSDKMVIDLTEKVNAAFAERVKPYLQNIFDDIKRRHPGLFKVAKEKPTAQAGLFGKEEAPAKREAEKPAPATGKTLESRAKTTLLEIDAETAQSRLTKTNLNRQFGEDVISYLHDNKYILFQADQNKFGGTTVKGREWAGVTLEGREKIRQAKKEEPKKPTGVTLKEAIQKSQEKKTEGKPLRPDGRLDPQPGDKVYMMAQGFGGTAAYINGEVYEKGGQRRVRITGAASMMGGGYSGPKTVALDNRWTVSGDPEIKRREQAREEERKQQSAKFEAQRQSGLDTQKENIAKAVDAGEKVITDATTLKRGQVVTYHDQVGGSTKYQSDDVKTGDDSIGLYEIGKTPEWGTDNDGNIIRYSDVTIQIWGPNNKNVEQLTTTGTVQPFVDKPTLDMPNLPEWVRNDLQEKETAKPKEEKKPVTFKEAIQKSAQKAQEQVDFSADINKTKFGSTLSDGRKLVAKNIASERGAQQGYVKDNQNREIVEYKEPNGATRFAVVEKIPSKLEAKSPEQKGFFELYEITEQEAKNLVADVGDQIKIIKEYRGGKDRAIAVVPKTKQFEVGDFDEPKDILIERAKQYLIARGRENDTGEIGVTPEQPSKPTVKQVEQPTEAERARTETEPIPPVESARKANRVEPEEKPTKNVRRAETERETEINAPATRITGKRNVGKRQGETSQGGVSKETQPSGKRLRKEKESAGATGEPGIRGGERISGVSERGRSAVTGREPTRGISFDGDFRITDDVGLGKGGKRKKFNDNLVAIKLLKQLESEGRNATLEEQSILVKYVGWGGLANEAFGWRYEDQYGSEQEELKKLLSEEEFDAARASTPNAHYTSPPVVRAIYSALEKFGFKGGKMIEPGSGIGNFIGLLPDAIYGKSRFTAIEMDEISGRILKKLYPSADLRLQPFQETRMPDNFYDAMTGNVPFGNVNLFDPEINKKFHQAFSIHNFFIIKALQKVRSGGVMGFVTSRFTMDSQAQDFRKLVGEQADFIGAIRLPKETFGENAQTEVVTDILFFKKRAEGEKTGGEKWIETKTIKGADGGDIQVNEYYAKHPEMMIGDATLEGSMYGENEPTWSLKNADATLPHEISKRVENLPEGVYTEEKAPHTDAAQKEDERIYVAGVDDTKQGGYGITQDGQIGIAEGVTTTIDENGRAIKVPQLRVLTNLSKAQENIIRNTLAVRNAVREVYRTQLKDESMAVQDNARKKLNKEYDSFVKKHGFLNLKENSKAFESDPDAYIVLALENFNPETQKATKTDIFSKQVIVPRKNITKADTAADALIVSLAQKGVIDFYLMTELTGKDTETLQSELAGLAYHVPGGDWVPADEYLSGNVRAKLETAKEAAKADPAFQANVDALEKVQPAPLDASKIIPRLGAAWIPEDVIAEFAGHISGATNGWRATRVGSLGQWNLSEKDKYTESDIDKTLTRNKWGTLRRDAMQLLGDAMNLRTPVIYDKTDTGSVLNTKESALAQQKLQALKDEFVSWAYKEPERRKALVEAYNRDFNNVRLRSFNGDHLTFDGMTKVITPRKHQRDAIWQILAGGNTLVGHKVGAGKTITMIAAGMEARRMGIFKKPMYVVKKHMLPQFRNEFLQLYPGANILVADEDNFHGKVRKQFMARIATGDWDAVIVTHPSLKFIPMSAETETQLLKEERNELLAAEIALNKILGKDAKKDKSVKEIEKTKQRIDERLKKLSEIKRDDAVTFEQLGVDMLFVDESQNFKNLFYATKMNRVLGLGKKEGGPTSFDLYMKTRHISKINGGERGVIFSTGTPISNSMSEMYLLMKYLQPMTLRENGLTHFDSWAATFGEVVNAIERTATGKYEPRARFSKFVNIPELAGMFRRFADVKTSKDLPELQKLVPEAKGGQPIAVIAKSAPELEEYMKFLINRAENLSPQPQKGEDNWLSIGTDARKAGLDMRLVRPGIKLSTPPKVELAADNIFRIWKDTVKNKSTQIVFCDLSAPSKTKFNIYDELKRLLVAKGMPVNEIAFIHDANNDEKKANLFLKVNRGDVRVIVGSTAKLGEGTNIQRKLIAIHHMDAPYRPSDVEQRNGRIFRQGNENEEVEEYRYATEKSFDTNMWQKLEQKARFISQIMTSDLTIREAEDVTDAFVTSAAEMKAITSGDPRIMELVQLDVDINKMELLRSAHNQQIYELQDRIARLPNSIAHFDKLIKDYNEDLALARKTEGAEDFNLTLGGKTYTDRKDATQAFIDAVKNKQKLIGKYRGFRIEMDTYQSLGVTWHFVKIKGVTDNTYDTKVSENPETSIIRIDNEMRRWPEQIEEFETERNQRERELASARKEINTPFAQEKELQDKIARKFQILGELSDKGEKTGEGKAPTEKYVPSEETDIDYGESDEDEESPSVSAFDIAEPYEPTPARDLKNAVADAVRRAQQAEADQTAKQTEQGKKKETSLTPDEIAAIGHRVNEIIIGKKDLKSLPPEEKKGLDNLLAALETAGRTLGKTPEEKAKLSFANRIAFDDAIKQLKTKEARETIAKIRRAIKEEKPVEPTFLDKLAEWTASMYIWRLGSAGKSISSNLAMNLIQYPEIKMAAWFNNGVARRNKVAISIRPQEAMEDFRAAWMGGHIKDAWREAMRYMHEENNIENSEFFKREQIKARAIKGKKGRYIRAGLNAQAAIDVFFRTIAVQGEIARQIFRKAMQQTENRIDALKLSEEYQDKIEQVDTLMKSGKEIPEELAEFEKILNNARKHVLVETFQEELHGIFQTLSQSRRHALLRIFVPFFNTQMNILKQAFARTPFAVVHPEFLSLGKKYINKTITQEEAGQLSERLAQITTGMIAFGAMLFLLHWMGDDDEITGDWDINKLSDKPLGWQANSVRIGNRYISYQGIEPFATMFRAVGNIRESKQTGLNAAIDGLTQVTINNPLTSEIFDIMNTAKQGNADEFFVKMVAGMALPGIAQDVSKIVDITARRKDTLLKKGLAQVGIPGYTLTLPPVVDVFGQGIVSQTRGERALKILTGLGVSAIKDDPARAEIHHIGLKMSVRSFTYKKVKLTPDEAMRLNQMIGRRFHEQVMALLKNPTYRAMSSEKKKKMIISIRQKLLDYYKKTIAQTPGFRARMRAQNQTTVAEQ